jgi:hypothetical protein
MSHVNITDIDFTKLKIGKTGRTVKVLYENNPLQIVTTKMYTPFGVKVNNSDYSHFTNCHLDSSLNQNNSQASTEVRQVFEDLDQHIVELIKQNQNVFQQKDIGDIDFDNDNFYSPIFKGNSNYPKLMKISLPRDKNGNFDFVIFDENKQKVPINDSNVETVLAKGRIFKSIIECSKVWTYKGKIGTTWNIIQMRFVPKNEVGEPEETTTSSKNIYNQNLMLDD